MTTDQHSFAYAQRALPAPVVKGVIKEHNADFGVTERLGFDLSGDGPHLLVQIEKDGATTLEAIDAVARYARIKSRDIGYCGLKDRYAVTRQWLSLPLDNDLDWADFETDQWRVSAQARNRRKLRIGAHQANEFVLVVRNVEGELASLDERVATVGRLGVPNYFGPQRFGRNGDNLRRARRWFVDGEALARRQRRFALSAARSLLFNRVLSARVADDSWQTLVPGEPVCLDGSNSFFKPDDPQDATLAGRLARQDVHTSGPLWGRGESAAVSDCLALENEVAASCSWLSVGVAKAGPKQERRALRLPVREFSLKQNDQLGEQTLTLKFVLGKGSFATSVLHELLDIADLRIFA